MKTKKFVFTFMVLLVIIFVSSCKHSHLYSQDWTSDETSHWHECECGEKNELANHTWNEGIVLLNPTVNSEGKKLFSCTVCGKNKEEKLEKLTHEHTFVKSYKSDDTNHWYECECGETSELAAHEFDWVVKRNGTCTKTKLEEGTCVCGLKVTREGETLPHDWDEGVVILNPTVDSEGKMLFTCTNCSETLEKSIDKLEPVGIGTNFEADVTYMISNPLNNLPVTIEANIKLSKKHIERGGVIFSNYGSNGNSFSLEIYTNGNPRLYYTNEDGLDVGYIFDECDVRSDDFVHMVMSFDEELKSASVYLDGKLIQTISVSKNIINGIKEENFFIGGDVRTNNTQYFKGSILSFSVYSKAKSSEEIKNMYNNGLDLTDESLLASYDFDNITISRELKDLSKNENNISVELKWFDNEQIDLDYAYSFAVIGDTQKITEKYPDKLHAIYDWLIENKDEHKIENVLGLGDITETWNKEANNKLHEWDIAKEAISKMDGVMRYSLIRGNHDEAKYFNQTFNYEAYTSQFDGFMVEGDLCNSYMTFKAGKVDYLLVNLDFGANDEMLKWASDIIVSHPNHQVIITTHAYLYNDGTTLDKNDPSPASRPGNDNNNPALHNGYNDGDQIWEKLIKHHPNIKLVLSGHDTTDKVVTTQTKGVHGNTVTQMLIDPQGMDADMAGVGMICMLYFNEDGTKMEVEYFSTDKDQYYKYSNQYNVDLSEACTGSHTFEEEYDETSHYEVCECGYKHNEEEHTFDEGTILVNGTCDTEGSIKYSCTGCEYSKTETILAAHGNSVLNKDDTNHWFTCETCGENYDVEEHTFGEEVLIETIESISTTKECSCGYVVENSLKGNGEESNPYLISTELDFINFVKFTQQGIDFESKNIKLVDSFTLTDGNIMVESFAGTFDGNGKTISGLAISNDTNITGLFKKLTKTGVIKNLTLEGEITGTNKIGAFVGESNGTIINCINNTTIYGDGQRGGIVGYATGGLIENCINNGNLNVLTSGWNVGGILGEGKAEIKGCTNNGTVYGKSTHIAGIVGSTTSNVIDCLNKGDIIGASWGAGGIVGYVGNVDAIISGCENIASVNGTGQIGGIVGKAMGTVEYCINRGSVNGSSEQLGGIVGVNFVTNDDHKTAGNTNEIAILYCDNYGDITGTSRIGGIIGRMFNGLISQCKNHSTVSIVGTNTIGGIVGEIPWTKDAANNNDLLTQITNCQNDAAVINSSYFGGGIIGAVNQTKIEGCINNGNVGGKGDCAGGIAGTIYNTSTVINSINNGLVKGKTKIGGIAFDSRGTITGCENNGNLQLTTADGTAASDGLVHTNTGTITDCVNNGQIIPYNN